MMAEPPSQSSALPRWGHLLAWFSLAIAALFVVTHMRINTSITHFLVSPDSARLGSVMRALADSDLSRVMVFTVEGPTVQVALDAAEDFVHSMEADPEVERIRAGITPGVEKATYDLYFPRRFRFASEHPAEALPDRLSPQGLRVMAQSLRETLVSPLGPAVKTIAPRDPWLFFHERLQSLDDARLGTVALRGDRFVTEGERHAVVFLTTRHSPFSSPHQAPLDMRLDRAIETIEAARRVRFERSSVHRLALRSERSIRADIRRISTLSLIGIIAIFLVVYRSLRWLLLALLPLAVGITVAMAVGLALFGELHGLTLAFGSTLIGVCIDYPVHYFTHRLLGSRAATAQASLQRVWPGLLLGACTTLVGFSSLAWASFPGIREIGVFSAVGVAAALLATRILLPPLLGAPPRPPRFLARFVTTPGSTRDRRRRGPSWVLLGAAALLCALGLPRVAWVDDTQALNRLEPGSLDEDERVRGRVSRLSSGRFVLAVGADEEQALRRNDQVYRALEDGRAAKIRSLHAFLWSQQLQDRSLREFTDRPDLAEQALDALEEAGFRRSAFAELASDLSGPHPAPLRSADLLGSPLDDVVRPFFVPLGDEVAILTYLEEVSDPDLLAQRLASIGGVIDFDRQALLTSTYREYRQRTQWLVAMGLGLVGLAVGARYRSLRLLALAFLPAVLAALTTMAILALSGVTFNLLHLVGVLLVLSIGVDYGVFLAESLRHPEGVAVTFIGLVIACLSTVAGFGLLGLSTHPALQAVGVTTGLGVLLSLAFAPTLLFLVESKGPRPRLDSA